MYMYMYVHVPNHGSAWGGAGKRGGMGGGVGTAWLRHVPRTALGLRPTPCSGLSGTVPLRQGLGLGWIHDHEYSGVSIIMCYSMEMERLEMRGLTTLYSMYQLYVQLYVWWLFLARSIR